MSVDLPESLDVWRAVAARRIFEGRVALADMPRLRSSLVDDVGECAFRLAFERDALGQAVAEVEVQADLPLLCQRSLERFLHPVRAFQRLGLIRDEGEEAGLAADLEPLLVPPEGRLVPLEMLEDELILALPLLPTRPGSQPLEAVAGQPDAGSDVDTRPHPFAALAALKRNPH